VSRGPQGACSRPGPLPRRQPLADGGQRLRRRGNHLNGPPRYSLSGRGSRAITSGGSVAEPNRVRGRPLGAHHPETAHGPGDKGRAPSRQCGRAAVVGVTPAAARRVNAASERTIFPPFVRALALSALSALPPEFPAPAGPGFRTYVRRRILFISHIRMDLRPPLQRRAPHGTARTLSGGVDAVGAHLSGGARRTETRHPRPTPSRPAGCSPAAPGLLLRAPPPTSRAAPSAVALARTPPSACRPTGTSVAPAPPTKKVRTVFSERRRWRRRQPSGRLPPGSRTGRQGGAQLRPPELRHHRDSPVRRPPGTQEATHPGRECLVF
jgi:hypothetical protein